MKKVLRVTFLLTSLLVWTGVCRADQWAKAYGENNADWMYAVQETPTPDGGYVAAGYTESFGSAGASNVWVIKLAADGSILWEKTYSGAPNYDWATAVKTTSVGGYIIAGYTECFGAQQGDAWVIKVNGTGDIVWETRYGGAYSDEATSIEETFDGGYVVAGRTKSFDSRVSDIWVIKLTGTGDITWENRYGGSDFDTARSIQQTSDGGYVLAGDTWHTGSGTIVNSDIVVLKLNPDGTIQWQKTYGDTDSDSACCIQETPDGGYILLGDTRSFNTISSIWVLKLTSTGTISWQKTYGANWSYASSLDQAADGGYIVAGHTHDFGAGLSDIMLLKLTSTGTISWQKTYGGSDFEWSHAVKETAAGEYLIAGRTRSFGAGSDDALIIKVDGNGDIPDCSMIGTSSAVATDTSIADQDGVLTITPTAATAFDSTAFIDNSAAEVEAICPFSGIDSDGDSIPDQLDNCPNTPNPLQEDTFPPAGNSCGDICECEGNFDGDGDVDGTDATTFKSNFGRNQFTNPCESVDPCNGDVDCDGDVDGSDASLFKADFGRNAFNNPCPSCLTIPWCTYL